MVERTIAVRLGGSTTQSSAMPPSSWRPARRAAASGRWPSSRWRLAGRSPRTTTSPTANASRSRGPTDRRDRRRRHQLGPGNEAVAAAGSLHAWSNAGDNRSDAQVELRPGSPGFEKGLRITYGVGRRRRGAQERRAPQPPPHCAGARAGRAAPTGPTRRSNESWPCWPHRPPAGHRPRTQAPLPLTASHRLAGFARRSMRRIISIVATQTPVIAASSSSLNALAGTATLHCLTGGAAGEVTGMVIGSALGLANLATLVLAVGVAFLFGYVLTSCQYCVRASRSQPLSRLR